MVCCKAYNCSNTGKEPGIRKHAFPKDPETLRLWIMKINRADFTEKDVNKSSMLCSAHFVPSDYENNPFMKEAMGIKLRSFRLKRDAVPSIFSHKPQKERHSSALEKRKRKEALEAAYKEYEDKYGKKANCQSFEQAEKDDHHDIGNDHRSNAPACDEIAPGTSVQTDGAKVDNKGVHVKPSMQNKKSQTVFKSKDRAIQTMLQYKDASTQYNPPEDHGSDNTTCPPEPMEEEDNDDDNDPDWLPGQHAMEADSDDDYEEQDMTIGAVLGENRLNHERKFLVYESCLQTLLAVCVVCFLPCKVILQSCNGSLATIKAICKRGHVKMWQTQPMLGLMPQGNLDIAAGILFSGSTASKALNMMKHMNIPTITTRTFLRLQKFYLIPAIFQHWKDRQNRMLKDMEAEQCVTLSGDGRYDSTGHLAKYLSYSFINMKTGLVTMVKLVQKNECTSAMAMELEGFKRCITEVLSWNISIESIVTDRHVSIRKYLRENHSTINHWFDIWHVAKSVQKKIQQASKKRASSSLHKWAKGISNHLFFCATTSDGDGQLVKAKWESILNHVVNKHVHDNDLYLECAHGDLSEEQREWLEPGSKAMKELELIIQNRTLLKDIQQLSPHDQTASIESYHRIVCYFAPKMLHFFHAAMNARLLLAALHFNENTQRQQKISKDGTVQVVISYHKYQPNRGVVKEVKVPCSFGYVQDLMETVYHLRNRYPTYEAAKHLVDMYEINMPQTLASQLSSAEKTSIVNSHISRFSTRM